MTEQEALNAARALKEYCKSIDSNKSCEGCIFNGGYNCQLKASNPDEWKIEGEQKNE